MLGKLIKHEFKATSRQLLPALSVLVVMSLISRFIMPFFGNSTSKTGELIYTLDIILFGASFIAVGVVAITSLIDRYKNSILGDEGYLTMTLPVSVNEILFSKLITYFCWFIAVMFAVAIALLVIMPVDGEYPIRLLFEELSGYFPKIKAYKVIILALELIVFGFCMFSSFCLHFYSSLAIGNIFNKKRSILTTLVFIGIMIVSSSYWSSILHFAVDAFRASESWMITGLVFIAFAFVQSAVLYFATTLVMTKRFNID